MDSFAHHEESRGARWPHAGHLSRYASRRRYFGTHALALEAHGGRGIMRLGALAGGLSGDAQDEIVTGFAIDHRKVAPGTIFGAFEGVRVNGEDFIADAIGAGAIAVVARPQAAVKGAVHLTDDRPRRLFAQLAAKVFAPFPKTVVAVTGTNGKTSTGELTRQLWHIRGENRKKAG